MQTCLFFLVVFQCCFFAICEEKKEQPWVTTPLGKIRGYHKKSPEGSAFSAFEGIPYAKPPIDQLRFEPPQPIEPWDGTWDAVSVTQCPQTELLKTNVVHGEEDCLYMNVYVPRELPSKDEKLDVVVHIHGGMFMYGSGHSYAHPEYFMDEGVVFVNFNYRIGVFGFLSTGDGVVSGNNGLKDQVMALKWIQKNIASFGGNPDSVTLTGLSAGASSVHYHFLSGMSKGLFHRGFSQSGVAINSVALQEKPMEKTRQLAKAVGCATTSSAAIVKCLKQRPVRQLLTKMSAVYKYNFFPVAPFAPVVEQGGDSFISTNPYYLLATGKVHDLPWLVSTVSHEGLFPGMFVHKELETIDEKWRELAPFLLDYADSFATSAWNVASKEIREEYFNTEPINEDNFGKVVQMFSDRFLVDVDAALKLQARANKSPIYYYQFRVPSDHNSNNMVAHGEDGQYFFYGMYNRKPTENDQKIKKLLMEMLITFVKTGTPMMGDRVWTPVSPPEIQFLNVSSSELEAIKMVGVKELGPKSFWNGLGFLENQNLVLVKDEL